MTLLLIFDELEKGTIKLTDEAVTSAHAKSMGIAGASGRGRETDGGDADQNAL